MGEGKSRFGYRRTRGSGIGYTQAHGDGIGCRRARRNGLGRQKTHRNGSGYRPPDAFGTCNEKLNAIGARCVGAGGRPRHAAPRERNPRNDRPFGASAREKSGPPRRTDRLVAGRGAAGPRASEETRGPQPATCNSCYGLRTPPPDRRACNHLRSQTRRKRGVTDSRRLPQQ